MMKDRLKDLQENIEKYDDGIDSSIINHFAVIDMEAPIMDNFFNQVGAVRTTIDKIIKLIADVEHLQHAMLAPQAFQGTKEALEDKMAEIKSLGHRVRIELKRMKDIHEMPISSREKNVRQRIIESQIDGMTKYFCAVMDKYYRSVIKYRERCIERIQRQAQLVEADYEIEEVLDNERLSMFPEIIMEIEEAKPILDKMELCHQELSKLENNIRDLHDMFFDISHLILFQGDQIDHIKNKTEDVAVNIIKYNKTIAAQKVSQSFHLKKKIYLIFGLIIITIISIVYLIEKLFTF